jgi:hypothetical protein
LFQKESQFKSSKRQELSALQKRINTSKEELLQRRALELQRLMRKYQNAKNELESTFKHQQLQAEKLGAALGLPK